MSGNTAEDDAREIRRAKAIELRVAGHTIREIAVKLGVSTATAHDDVRKMLEEVGKEASKNADAARGIELNRMDRFQREVDEAIRNAADNESRMKAIDRGIRISERRAKLQGIDAPVKQELAAVVSTESPKEIAARARALMSNTFGSVGPADDDEETPDPEGNGTEPTESSST